MKGLKINDLLNGSEGNKRQILLELKKLNKEAYQKVFLMAYIRSFKAKYRALQKTQIWKRARQLLMDYFLDGRTNLYCKRCDKLLTRNDCIMHHIEYSLTEIFTPLCVEFIDRECHKKIHKKNQ